MDIRNSGMQNFQNLRFNNAGGRAAIQSTAPTQDKVMDLTSPENIQAELNTQDVQFVRLKADKKEFFFDLSQMSPEQKQGLIQDLKAKVGTAVSRQQFDPQKFFDLTASGKIEYAVRTENFSTLTTEILDAQGILDKSMSGKGVPELNNNAFAVMNGNYTTQAGEGVPVRNALTKEDVPAEARVGEQHKPSEWYNGFQVTTNGQGQQEVSLYLRDKTQALPTAIKDLTIANYQQMLKNDFNFQGAVKFIQAKATKALPPTATPAEVSAKAEGLFIEAVGQKFAGGHPSLSPEQLKTVAQHVWSYASTGADTDGKVDIAKLQGMMRVLDPEIQRSGNNNGTGELFSLNGPGGKVSIRKGDEFHGRSTILQTRHLMADLVTQSSELQFTSQPDKIPGLQGYQESLILVDNSSSMGNDTQFLAQILKTSGIDGKIAVGTFIDKASPMEWSDKTGNETNGPVFMKPAESIALLDRQGNAHNQAYGPGADPTAAPGSAFAIEPENKGSDSVSANVDVKVNGVYHTVKATWNENHMRESGIEAGIQALAKLPDMPPSADGKNSKQMVLVTDETDAADPKRLALLQSMAKKKGVDVKVMVINSQTQSVRMVNVSLITDQQRNAATQDTVTETLQSKKSGLKNENQISAGGNGRYMMDWNKIAEAQAAPTYNWYIPQ
jgi:hypothetical protein